MSTPAADVARGELLRETLVALKAQMPDKPLRVTCARFLESLNYTAPEMIDRRWAEVHEFLCTQVPQIPALQDIWNKASARYKQV